MRAALVPVGETMPRRADHAVSVEDRTILKRPRLRVRGRTDLRLGARIDEAPFGRHDAVVREGSNQQIVLSVGTPGERLLVACFSLALQPKLQNEVLLVPLVLQSVVVGPPQRRRNLRLV